MAKLAIIVPPLSGHVNPTLGLGAELLKRGHQVAWISLDPSLKDSLPKGANFLLLSSNLTNEERDEAKKKLIEKSVYGLDSLKFLYEEVLIPMNTYILGELSSLLDDFAPDLVITDHQVFAGAIAATLRNIPYVTSVTAPAAITVNESLPKIFEWEEAQIVKFQQDNGVEGDERLDCSKQLTLVYTSKLFFRGGDFPSNYKFIGPTVEMKPLKVNFDWEKMKTMGDRPRILVSIGTTFDHVQKKKFFTKVVEALENEDVTVIVVSDPKLFDKIPDNFIIQPLIPQIELMPHVQLVICHGGQNTVCEALFNSIPLIVIPIAYDQSYVAGCVTDNKAGIRLNFNRFKAIELNDAVHSILDNNEYTENAKKIQKSFQESGSVVRGVDYIEELL